MTKPYSYITVEVDGRVETLDPSNLDLIEKCRANPRVKAELNRKIQRLALILNELKEAIDA